MTTTDATKAVRTTELVDSSGLLDDPAALRARAEQHGYLFFRQLLPREAVLDVRRRFLEILDRHGWLADGHPLDDGIADLEAFAREDVDEIASVGSGVTPSAYRDVQRVRQFHELAHHPRLVGVYQRLFDSDVFVHPRNIARLMIPSGKASPTPPHQDFIHIQGTQQVWTAWVPIGDTPRELGGLTVLDGSHRDGLLSYKDAHGAGGLEAYLCDLDLTWAEADFEAGDVVTFGSHTVHRALPNTLPGHVRLSSDFRYQPASAEITEASLRVHCDVLSWDEIYESWPQGGLQWYWRDENLPRAVWDETLKWQKDKIC